MSTDLPPLELLFEEPGLPTFPLPDALAAAYGGSLGLEEPCFFANFVATVDGIVAIPSIAGSNKLIAAASATDRFVMGLLRACADVLVIGSGTLTASPRSVWTADQAYPDAADDFRELRRRLGREEQLAVAVLSASGAVDPHHPAFAAGATLVTTDAGAQRLSGALPTAQLVSLGESLDVAAATELLRARGHRSILSEGGPTVFGSLLAAGVVDELFLTVSPLIAGRTPLDPRLGLVEDADLLPEPPRTRLVGLRRDGSHLFLRYRVVTEDAG
ncbi:MAG: dihydrofolate reductase family protein [Actinomycetes bacterium]